MNFQKFAGCPFCGRYLLRIDLELSREARSTGARKMFNIGDSQGNDGYSESVYYLFIYVSDIRTKQRRRSAVGKLKLIN